MGSIDRFKVFDILLEFLNEMDIDYVQIVAEHDYHEAESKEITDIIYEESLGIMNVQEAMDYALKVELNSRLNLMIPIIDQAIAESSSEQEKENYIEFLYSKVRLVKEAKHYIIEKYPPTDKVFTDLFEYVNKMYKPKLFVQITKERDGYKPPFKIKHGYPAKSFSALYDLLVEYLFIEDDEISEADFTDVISGAETTEHIRFLVKNGLVANFLESISYIYTEVNGRMIEDSKRFYSKQNTVITQSNYNASKSRITAADSILIEKLRESIKQLFPVL